MTPVRSFPVYGLDCDPFELAVLDPLARPEDEKIVSLVDGWSDLTDAENLIRARAVGGQPVYFVVEGASQTGRTSVANYLVYLWAREWCRPGSNIQIITHRRDRGPLSGNYFPADQVHDWISNFYLRLVRDRRVISETARNLITALKPSPDQLTPGASFALALLELEIDLLAQDGQQFQFAAIIENGKGKDLVQIVLDAFSATRAIVVVTIDESEDTVGAREDIDKTLGDAGRRIPLSTVQGAEVATIIANRWNLHRPGVPSPFDADEVAQAFNRPRPIARTVKLLSKMLELQQWRFQHLQRPWPNDQQLAMDAKSMRDLLALIDGQMDL
jgi:hypothetical protein